SSRTPESGRPSLLACLECRQKHLKCDAVTPRCSRCVVRGLDCSYTPSRRGCVGRSRKRPLGADVLSPPRTGTTGSLTTSVSPNTLASQKDVPSPSRGPQFQGQASHPRPNVANGVSVNPAAPYSHKMTVRSVADAPRPPQSATSADHTEAHLLNLYYTHFHPTHPILLPRGHHGWHAYPNYLRVVVQFVGSHWAPSAPSAPFQATAARELEATPTASPHTVQAYLLLAIVLHAGNELRNASKALDKAIDHALMLRMYDAQSPTLRSSDPVVEESHRRTWWELWITDGYCAALNRQPSWRSDGCIISTPLPCEEPSYSQGIIPLDAPTPQQFRERLFADDDQQYSSYCYRIEAMRIISRVLLVASSCDAHPDGVQAVDNAIAGWRHHLSDNKAGILDELGEVDQLMFQAHTFIQFASILLHFPRSELPLTFPSASEVACAREIAPVTPTSTQHAIKATAASKEMSNLAALPVEHYSPFFICGLVFSCMVQLSACYAHSGNCFEQHQDRVALMTGVLRSLGRRWEIANCALARLRPVANEIF
ncbi:hypothetical protein BAUCODRAFT_42445, partial [Baudoinia panamericana UAMH 10762]